MKSAVKDALNDFYNQVLSTRFDNIEKKLDVIKKVVEGIEGIEKSLSSSDHDLTKLRISNEALIKLVEYSDLQLRISNLEQAIDNLSKIEERLTKLEGKYN